MAYRLAEEHYNRRYGPAVQQHHSQYQQQAPAPAASNSYNSGGSSFQNPRPPRGRGRRRETAPSFPFPEPPHNAHSSSYGSGFPVETPVLPPVPLFRDGRDHVGLGEDRSCWSGDRFHQESDIHRPQTFPRERYHEQHQNFYNSREEPLAGYNPHLSGPPRLQESFHNDVEWGNSGFSVVGREPQPLMQVRGPIGGEVAHQTSHTGFDSRSWGGVASTGDRFLGQAQHQWPGDGLREARSVESGGMGREMYRLDWNHRQTEQQITTNFPPQYSFDNVDFSTDAGLAIPMSGHYPQVLGPEASLGPRENPRGNREKHPQHQRPPPRKKKGRERGGRGRGRGGRSTPLGQGGVPVALARTVSKSPLGQGSVSTASPRTVSKSPHRPSSVKRESKSGDRSKESAKKMEKRPPLVKKSPTKRFQNRKVNQRNRMVAENQNKGRQLSPMAISDRLGPHIPGSGSVQNRLGPPKKGAAGVHSRLGPEEHPAPSRDSIHSGLEAEGKLTSSDGIQFRLGPPEENLNGSHGSSTSVHCRLGLEEINLSSTSRSLFEVSNVSETFPPSTSVHSRLGPNTNPLTSSALSGGLEISDPLPSERIHYRLGPKEIGTDPLSSSLLSGGLEISDPLSSERLRSRLGSNDINNPLSSCTLSGGLEISDPLFSDHVRSHLDTGPLSSDLVSGGLDILDPLASEHLHSRLGSRDIETDRLSTSALSGGLEISDPLASERVHSRLEINTDRLGSSGLSGGLEILDPLPSERVRSRLGSRDIGDPLSSSTLPGGLEISEPLSYEHAHSQLRPADENLNSSRNSLSMVGASEGEFVDTRPIDGSVHSRLGPEERFDLPLYSNSAPSPFRHDNPPISGSHRSQFLYSRLGPEQSFGSEDVGFHLGPEIPHFEPESLRTEPMYLSETLGDYSEPNSQTRQASNKLSSFKPDDVSLRSSTYSDVAENSPQIGRFQSEFPMSRDSSDGGTAVDSSANCYVVIDDAANSQLHFSESNETGIGGDFESDKEGFMHRTRSSASNRKFDLRASFSTTPQNINPTDTSNEFSSKQTTRLCDAASNRNRKSELTSTSLANETGRMSHKRTRRSRRESGRVPAPMEIVGESIPTILKQKVVPPPAKKPKLASVKGGPVTKQPSRESLRVSVSSSYSSPIPAIGYKDASSDEGRMAKRRASNRLSTNSVSKGKAVAKQRLNKAADKSSVGSPVDMRDGQSTPRVKVGVATVVKAEREMEEGELTDSECEDLVIDLDTSTSSSHPPNKEGNPKPIQSCEPIPVESPAEIEPNSNPFLATAITPPNEVAESEEKLTAAEPNEIGTTGKRTFETEQEMAVVDDKLENETETEIAHRSPEQAETARDDATEKSKSTPFPIVECADVASEKLTVEATVTAPVQHPPIVSSDSRLLTERGEEKEGRRSQPNEVNRQEMQKEIPPSVVEICTPNSESSSRFQEVVTSDPRPISTSNTSSETNQPATHSPTTVTNTTTTLVPSQPFLEESGSFCGPVRADAPTKVAELVEETELENLEPMTTSGTAFTAHDEVETEKGTLDKQEDIDDTENTADANQPLATLLKDDCDNETASPIFDTKSEEKNKNEKGPEQAIAEDDIETASISSGEIVSSSPPSPSSGQPTEEQDPSKDPEKTSFTDTNSYGKPWVSRNEPEWKSNRYFPTGPRRDPYGHWRTRSPIRESWYVHSRRRSGPFDISSEKWRSKSRSPSPVRRSSRRGWRRCSSPEEMVLRRRRRRSRSLSPGRRAGRGRPYGDGEKRRKTTDGGGEAYGRSRRMRGSRSCDRMSDRASCESSDEDLEVLELRKEAILSMLTDGVRGRLETKRSLVLADDQDDVNEINAEIGKDSEAEAVATRIQPEVSEEAETEGKEDAKIEDEVFKSLANVEHKENAQPLSVDTMPEETCTEKDKRTATCFALAPLERREAILKTRTDQRADESQSPKSSPKHTLSSQPSTSQSSAPSSRLQPLVKRVGKSRGPNSQVISGKRVSVVGKLAVVAATKSGSGSGMGSPSSSCGSPAPVPASLDSGGGSGTETLRRGNDARPPTSVKILPGSKGTWEIPEFHIQLAESDGEGTENESGTGGEGVKSAHQAPTMDEIDSILGAFRREAEAKARSKEKIVSSPDPLPLRVEDTRRSPEVVPPRVDLEALGMLPLQRQREYLELKTKLALYAKKQREEEMAVKAKDKGKRPLNAGSSKKAKVVPQSEQVKSIETVPQRSLSEPTLDSSTVARVKQLAKKKREDEQKKDEQLKKEEEKKEEQRKKEEKERKKMEAQKRTEEEEMKNREQQRRKEEEERKKKEKQEREKHKFEKRKKKCEMKIAELEGKIRSCRSQSERWTKTLAAETNSLAECESEVEEHELKIELLAKQLELARSSRDKCKNWRTALQNEVQCTRESIGRHAVIIQDTQQLLIRERELLINMEFGNHSDGTDEETVSMEIDSDGSKGEEEMEIVTSSDEEEHERNMYPTPSLAPLNYETISDAEESPIQSDKSTPRIFPMPVSGTAHGPSRGRGKRRMSRSQRTRRSSLSVFHTAAGTDSDTEHSDTSKTRKQVILAPPIPSSPPPLTPPPPPPNAPTPAFTTTTSPSSLLSLAAHTLSSLSNPAVTITNTYANKTTAPRDTSEGNTLDSSQGQGSSSNTLALPKPQGGLVFSATLPVPPIDVEFLTDTDTASESGVPGSTPLVSSRDPMLSGIGSDDTPASEGTGLVGSPEPPPPPPLEPQTPKTLPEIIDSASALGDLGAPTLTESLSLAEPLDTSCGRFPLPLPVSLAACDALYSTATGSTDIASSSIQENPTVMCDPYSTPKNDGESSDGLAQLCVESEPCSSGRALDSSPLPNNLFISMLKISKIESLSESDAFSPVAKSRYPFRSMSPGGLGDRDATPCPDESPPVTDAKQSSAPNAEESSVVEQSSTPTAQIPGNETVGVPSTVASRLTERKKEIPGNESSESGTAPLPVKLNETRLEKWSSKTPASLPRDGHFEEVSQQYKIESVGTDSPLRRPAVYVAVIDPDLQLMDGSSSTVTQQRMRLRQRRERAVDKRESLLKAQPGWSGRVEKPMRKQVRKLPLSRSGSDTVVAIETTRNRRKSTPRRLSVPKTACSSPTIPSKSPTFLMMGSPTLNKALQSTLTSALAPALENALCPSTRSPQPEVSKVVTAVAKPNRDTVSRSPDLSTKLCKTLQRTLDLALSPVLESVLSPTSYRRQMGQLKESTASSEGNAGLDTEIMQQPATSGHLSHDDHGEVSHDSGTIPSESHIILGDETREREGRVSTASKSTSPYHSPPPPLNPSPPSSTEGEVSTGVPSRADSGRSKQPFARKSTGVAVSPSRNGSGGSKNGSGGSKNGSGGSKKGSGGSENGSGGSKKGTAKKSTGVHMSVGGTKRGFAKKSTSAASQVRAKTGVVKAQPGSTSTFETSVNKNTNTPVPKSQESFGRSKPSLDAFLGKIRQVMSNLEKQGRGSSGILKGAPASKELSKKGKPVQQVKSTARGQQAKPVQPDKSQVTVTRATLGVSSKERGLTQPVDSVAPAYSSNKLAKGKDSVSNIKQGKKSGRLVVPTVIEESGITGTLQFPWKKAGESSVPEKVVTEVEMSPKQSGSVLPQGLTSMDDVVERLGFRVTWNELQLLLRTVDDPSQSVTACTGTGLTGNPLLNPEPELVSESVVEPALNFPTRVSTGDSVEGSVLGPKRFRPYSSPLLALPAYRLNPSYRTHAKLSLSSLSHSHKIDPMMIWCKFEVFGKCGDPQCTRQHFRDVTLSKSELVDDIVSYSPALSSDNTKVSKTSKDTAKASSSKTGAKGRWYGESLMETFSGKMSDEQLLVLAAHRVSESRTAREDCGVLALEELRVRDSDVAQEGSDKTRQPPLYWDSQVPTYTQYLPVTAATDNRPERYFRMPFNRKATPTDPTDSAHFLSLAKGAKDSSEACKHVQSGLSLHPYSQELWLEYLERKSECLTEMPDSDDKRTELVDKALASCPTYPVVAKCVHVSVTVSEKSSCFVKGYHALTKKPGTASSLSLRCVELLLSHAHLHCISGHMTRAVSALKLCLGRESHAHLHCTSGHPTRAVSALKLCLGRESHDQRYDDAGDAKSGSGFTGISDVLSPSHLQLVCLSLVHIMYTSTFPLHLFLSSPSLPLILKQDLKTIFIPWSEDRKPSEEVLHNIETLLTSGMSKCLDPKTCIDSPSSHSPHSPHSPPEEDSEMAAFCLQYNMVLFQLVHRSRETARQSLTKLLSRSSHSSRLWMLAAQFEDWTSSLAMVSKILEKAKASELDSNAAEFYCCAVKLVMKQGGNGSHGDVLTAALPWLRSCVCRYYDISEENTVQLSLADTALLYRKLLGQLIPYDYPTPEMIRIDEERENLPYIWVAYCLLVQLSHHNLRGHYHHSGPEEAFESAVHSVNRLSQLRIVWLEYLTYLRENVVKRKNSQTAFQAFSDCVYRCLVIMDTKQAPPTLLPGQPTSYHDYSFQEQVCKLIFSTLPAGSKFTLTFLRRLVHKIPDSPQLLARYTQYRLNHCHSSLGSAQALLASYLISNPHSPDMWRLAIQVELKMRNKREARWMYREAVKHNPLSAALWKEFLLFELTQVCSQSSLSSSPLAQEVVTRASYLGVKLTPTQN